MHPGAETVFRDAYLVEFLDLPDGHRESDLHKSLVRNLRHFLAELGRGGMGSVLLGVRADDPFQKRVAIKLIKRGITANGVHIGGGLLPA